MQPQGTTIQAPDRVDVKNAPTQYMVRGGNCYYLTSEVPLRGLLPPGCYRPGHDDFGYLAQAIPVNTDKLLSLPYKVFKDVLGNIRTFWQRKDIFKEYGLVHKRGILLYGPPGSGKTSLILQVQKLLIEEQGGVVFVLTSGQDVRNFIGFMESGFQVVEPERPLVVLIEDIDSLFRNDDCEAQVLQLLDGAKQLNNIVYLATTNHLDRLEARITNRPSRFDRVYHIGFPDAKIRHYYLTHIIKGEDLAKIDIDSWVAQTEGFTFAHLRDIVVSVILLGVPFEETLAHLRGMADKPKNVGRENGKSIGFGASIDETNAMLYDDDFPFADKDAPQPFRG